MSVAAGMVLDHRYEIVSMLGWGGFGAVYKARDLAAGRAVVLKVVRPKSDDPSAERHLARFQEEIALHAELHHPHIVRLLDAGETGDGLSFAVLEHVPGEDLAAVLKAEGALQPEEARRLMLQVLDALRCAHARRVVHRDIKPANLLITGVGERREAIVIDFGIAARADERARGPGRPPIANEVLGTPDYGAPEQFRGGPPTPRSDLYAWGLVFIECLTGERVFGSGAIAARLRRQEIAPVPLPPALRDHPLGALLRRATEAHVEARAISAEQALRELAACDLRGLTRDALAPAGGNGRPEGSLHARREVRTMEATSAAGQAEEPAGPPS